MCFGVAFLRNSRGKRTFVAASHADKSVGKLFQVIERSRAFCLGSFTHLEARDELAKILVANLRSAEQKQPRRIRRELVRQPSRWSQPVAERADSNLRANLRTHATLLRLRVKARSAVDAIAVSQCDELACPARQHVR